MAKIILVDDEPAMLDVLGTLLRSQGHEVFPSSEGAKAFELIHNVIPDLIITDVNLGTVNGIDVLREAKQTNPNAAVIIITAYATVGNAVEAMKAGAFDYISKPFKLDEFQLIVERALSYESALRENYYLKNQVRKKYQFQNLIGNSPKMHEVYRLMEKVAGTDSTILILGESGTGKELVARALHYNSHRQNRSFVPINCSALPEHLLESELFGHRKGAFTGAAFDRKGLFHEADGGTIFLDEIGSMALALQTKLLRVLQDKEVRRVGDTQGIKVNVRVLAATNEPLQEKIAEKTFREDLYYRLSVIPIELPPLRERRDDIPLLVHHFLQDYQRPTDLKTPEISKEALEILANYDWPGNVRELSNAIERSAALCDDMLIHAKDLPPGIVAIVTAPKSKKKSASSSNS